MSPYQVKLFLKEGKRGKAYSIIEGIQKAQYENICMIDADLQYPPEVIPQMLKELETHGVVVANRTDADTSFARRFISKTFSFVFGKVLHGFSVDVQSGLKVFKKEIGSFINADKVTPWTL